MGELFSVLIFLFIAFSIIKRIAASFKEQQANQRKMQGQVRTQMPQQTQSLQEILRQEANRYRQEPAPKAAPKPAPKPQTFVRPGEGAALNRRSLEGTIVEGYKMEGQRVEGFKVEGRKDYYKHPSEKSPHQKERAMIESSMGKEFAGEGCEDHYRIRRKSTSRKRAGGKKIVFNKDTVVNGIIMSQVLTPRGGRRNFSVR